MKIHTLHNGQPIVLEGATRDDLSAQCIALDIDDPFAEKDPRKAADAAYMALPDAVRGQFAIAWAAIHARLEANDKAGALACFDSLTIPLALQTQAISIRNLLSKIP